MKRKILIGTTNPGKKKEIEHFLLDLPFEFITLNDIEESIEEPVEDNDTLEENCLLKAKYYANKTGYICLADDSGLFVHALGGWPGVHSALVGSTAEEKRQLVLERMQGLPKDKRSASFMTVVTVYDPDTDTFFSAKGEQKGSILDEMIEGSRDGQPYDGIFLAEGLNQTNAHLTVQQKNSVSSRGKALLKVKYFLENQYGAKHIVVPVAVIVDKEQKKMLMAKRNDPQRPEYHHTWEFPGGKMEIGESIEDNLVREVKEEIGVDVQIVESLSYIHVHDVQKKAYAYQVYLLPYIVEIAGGSINLRDEEVDEVKWCSLNEASGMKLLGDNGKLLDMIKPRLNTYIC